VKILVTGGSGFLGINLVRLFLEKGFNNITIIDLVPFDYPEKTQVEEIIGDIRDLNKVKEAMKNIDIVIHCAAALPLYSKEDIFTTDVDGTENLLTEAKKENVQRFIHISSTAVYGVPDHHPICENDDLVGVGHYGNAKIQAEQKCIQFRNQGMCIPIIRPKSFVGPERLGVFALFYDWAKDGRNFPMIGNGKNRYQLLAVEDLCESIFSCVTMDENIVNDVFNIGAKNFETMGEDYQAVLDYAGFNKKVIGFPAWPVIQTLRFLELLKISPLYKWVYETASKDSYVSIEKAEKKLNYSPRFSNKQALIKNYKWYLENMYKFKNQKGISHRVPWKQGVLKLFKLFF